MKNLILLILTLCFINARSQKLNPGLNSGNSWWASDGYTRSLTNSSGQIERSTSNGYNYKSIRCLKD